MDWHRATDVAEARATNGDGDLVLVREFENGGNVGGGLREDDDVRRVAGGPFVTGVCREDLGGGVDGFAATVCLEKCISGSC